MFQDRANASVIPILTALVIGYFFLDPPWRWLILIPAVVLDIIDITIWLRWRKKKSLTGSDAIVGTYGRVTSVEKPGVVVVKARGQLWRAEVAGDVAVGDEVVITGSHGIRLKVAPSDRQLHSG